MAFSRTPRQRPEHRTAALQRNAVAPQDHWDFSPGQRVATTDGISGVVDTVEDGPYPGTEAYVVTLDGGMGGGQYRSGELVAIDGREAASNGSPVHPEGSHSSVGHTAADDYPELAEILSERPPLEHAVEASGIGMDVGLSMWASKTPQPEHPSNQGDEFAHAAARTPGGEVMGQRVAKAASGQPGEDYKESTCQNCDRPIFWTTPRDKNYWAHFHNDDAMCSHEPGFKAIPKTAYTGDGNTVVPQHGSDTAFDDGWAVNDGSFDDVSAGDGRNITRADPAVTSHAGVAVPFPRRPGESEVGASLDDSLSFDAGWRNFLVDKILTGLPESDDPQNQWSHDWCRFRRDSHCFYPKTLNAEATEEAGYAVWEPEDRGYCPRAKKQAQKDCDISQPGPNSGDPNALIDATVSWDRGGQRGGLPGIYASVEAGDKAVVEFHRTAHWNDVRDKATNIRQSGGVRIISATDAAVTAEVAGETNIYQSSIEFVPGTRQIGMWHCGCAWANYSWARSGRWKKYEGRKCSHVTALAFEIQSQEYGGGTVTEMAEKPEWRQDPTLPVVVPGDARTKPRPWRVASGSAPGDPVITGSRNDFGTAEVYVEAYRTADRYGTEYEIDSFADWSESGTEVYASGFKVKKDGGTYAQRSSTTLSSVPQSVMDAFGKLRSGGSKEAGVLVGECRDCNGLGSADEKMKSLCSTCGGSGRTVTVFDGGEPKVMAAPPRSYISMALPAGLFPVKYNGRVVNVVEIAGGTVALDIGQQVAGHEVYHPSYDPRAGLDYYEASLRSTAGANSTGVMVALPIPDEVGAQLLGEASVANPSLVGQVEDLSNLHITLAYLGDTDEVDLDTLASVVAGYSAQAPSLAGAFSGYGVFENDEKVLVALVDIPGLETWREGLVAQLRAAGLDPRGDHGFTPHCTLLYSGQANSVHIPDALPASARDEIIFDSFVMAYGGDWTSFPTASLAKAASIRSFVMTGETGFWELHRDGCSDLDHPRYARGWERQQIQADSPQQAAEQFIYNMELDRQGFAASDVRVLPCANGEAPTPPQGAPTDGSCSGSGQPVVDKRLLRGPCPVCHKTVSTGRGVIPKHKPPKGKTASSNWGVVKGNGKFDHAIDNAKVLCGAPVSGEPIDLTYMDALAQTTCQRCLTLLRSKTAASDPPVQVEIPEPALPTTETEYGEVLARAYSEIEEVFPPFTKQWHAAISYRDNLLDAFPDPLAGTTLEEVVAACVRYGWERPTEDGEYDAYPDAPRMAALHEDPEPALPTTDGADEDLPFEAGLDDDWDDGMGEEDLDTEPREEYTARAHTTARDPRQGKVDDIPRPEHLNPNSSGRGAHAAGNSEIASIAKRFLKEGAKVFSQAEQQALINETGSASNTDKLDITGTHYVGLEEDEEDWMLL